MARLSIGEGIIKGTKFDAVSSSHTETGYIAISRKSKPTPDGRETPAEVSQTDILLFHLCKIHFLFLRSWCD